MGLGVANFVSLTGEGEPQLKGVGLCDVGAVKTTIFDLRNVLFSGTDVISGSGLAIVVSTGGGKSRISTPASHATLWQDAFMFTIMKRLNGRRPLNSFQRVVRKTCLFLVAFMVISFTVVSHSAGGVSTEV